MPSSRSILALLSLAFMAQLVPPAPAAASDFAQMWVLTGWDYVQDVGNTDGDSQRELLLASKADAHLALVDGLTGTIAKEFPEFKSDNCSLTATDVDADGRLELFFWRPANGPVTALVTGYDWDGANYATLFSHTDPAEYWTLLNLSNPTTFDALEFSATDVRVRNLSGTVIFRASTAVPGWSGDGASAVTMDIDNDGLLELGVIEHNFTPAVKVHFYKYAAGFTSAWSKTGWQPLGGVFSDGDPQTEVIMAHGADGHYALFDGLSGALEQDFPGFSINAAASLAPADTDGDGISELFLKRPENLPTTRLLTAYKWSAGTYTIMFSHTDEVDNLSLGHFRSTSGYDVLETTMFPNFPVGELRVRSLAGSVLFRASTQIPGWSGVGMFAAETDMDGDGLLELLIQDNTVLRFVRYTGAFVQSWSTSAWSLLGEPLNIDGDAQSELLVASTADQHYALLHCPTGALEGEFPAFTSDNGYVLPLDIDNDGRLELFFNRHSFAPPLSTGYDWRPSGYFTLFSHTDAIEGFGNAHFRNTAATEFAEFAPNDLRLRDLNGLVLFRASTDLPGWTGANRDMQVLDVNADGVSELLTIDTGAVRLVHFTGTTAVANPGEVNELQLIGNAPNPFRVGTALRFSTRAAGNVGIRVFDAGGRLVRRLDEHMTAGPHEIQWDGRDQNGHSVPSGILFYEVTADGTKRTGRMVRLGR